MHSVPPSALISTSGYSPKNLSIGHYNSSYFDWVTILFMFLGGMTFVFFYRALKGDFKELLINTELHWYIAFLLLFCGATTAVPVAGRYLSRFLEFSALRDISDYLNTHHDRVYHRRLRALAAVCADVSLCSLFYRCMRRIDNERDQDRPLYDYLQIYVRGHKKDFYPADGCGHDPTQW